MKFRHPDQKLLNILRLLPMLFWVVALAFAIHSGYRYFTGIDESAFWFIVGSVAVLYFSVRSWLQMKVTFVWGDESASEG